MKRERTLPTIPEEANQTMDGPEDAANRIRSLATDAEGGEDHNGRLESIGRLAGGIAHDFNNLLGVILNYARFVEEQLEPDSRAHADLQEIRRAAERGAALTRQLLVFGRREVMTPAVLDLGDVVSGLEDLLRRTVGAHIEVAIESEPGLWPIEADPTRIEQVILNLAVNARDAMPDGGTLGITTSNAELGAEDLRSHPGAAPGRFVRMVVRDTGVGMSGDVAARAFEPFFTTKPKEEGTGLGLATVFGTVTQAGGIVDLASDPGMGTAVEIHLPATHKARRETAVPAGAIRSGGGETVLVVEDEPSVLALTSRILTGAGYSVEFAPSATAALEVLDDRSRRLDLLIADVVLPGMPGTVLASRAATMRPGLRILLMSGYGDAEPWHRDPPRAAHAAFLEKPFDGDRLLAEVRSLLDAPARQPGGR